MHQQVVIVDCMHCNEVCVHQVQLQRRRLHSTRHAVTHACGSCCLIRAACHATCIHVSNASASSLMLADAQDGHDKSHGHESCSCSRSSGYRVTVCLVQHGVVCTHVLGTEARFACEFKLQCVVSCELLLIPLCSSAAVTRYSHTHVLTSLSSPATT